MEANEFKRFKVVSAKVRSGTATDAEVQECDSLQAAWDRECGAHAKPAPRTIFDLPIARRMFESDARDLRA